MKGRVILLDRVDGREAAALLVDGKLVDLRIDPPDDMLPGPETIIRGVVDRPLKGQGGAIIRLPDGTAFLRQAKGLSAGAPVIVQVLAVADRHKAPPVTTRLLFKSRYAIVTPDAPGLNIARSIRDEEERDRLLIVAHDTGDSPFGLILRSASEGVDADELSQDIAAMRDLAGRVLADLSGPPEYLVGAPSAHQIAWRDWSDRDPDEVVAEAGCFDSLGVSEAIDTLLSPNVPLPSGASALIEPTSALVAVDVNTGPDGSPAAGLKANLALARDLPRQLSLRGLGGQVTLDLAPMPKKERRTIEDAVRKAFRNEGRDTVLAGWTPLGHFELQRKRDRWPLSEVWTR